MMGVNRFEELPLDTPYVGHLPNSTGAGLGRQESPVVLAGQVIGKIAAALILDLGASDGPLPGPENSSRRVAVGLDDKLPVNHREDLGFLAWVDLDADPVVLSGVASR